MLQHLSIENYALIRSLQITFNEGFMAVTGETGAGKSIILGALGLLIGQRADTQVLFDKNRKCVIEATFDIRALGIETFFEENDIDYDDNLLIRREILPTAKSRAFVNDIPVQLQLLKDLGAKIIDIHSQNQTITLLNPEFQLCFLDSLAGNTQMLEQYAQEFSMYTSIKKELECQKEELQQSRRDKDYNQFLFDELENAKLVDNEQEDLEQELKLLNNTESIKQTFGEILEIADHQDDAAIPRLISAKSQLSKIVSDYPDIEEFYNRLDSAVIELRDVFSEIENRNENLVYSAERQQYVSERLDLIYHLQQKHGVNSVAKLLEIKSQLNEKLLLTNNLDKNIQELEVALVNTEMRMNDICGTLSERRKSYAKKLEQEILPKFSALGMSDARLKVVFTNSNVFLSNGKDCISMFFSANRGGEMRELGKVISGGELSRLMLALKTVVVKSKLLPTIIFDEIDTGVSGSIAGKMANMMAEMAENTQVIAITHLPQIAAKASNHLKVFKTSDETSTHTSLVKLTELQRVEEIAKMLSAEHLTKSAIETAKELMHLNN